MQTGWDCIDPTPAYKMLTLSNHHHAGPPNTASILAQTPSNSHIFSTYIIAPGLFSLSAFCVSVFVALQSKPSYFLWPRQCKQPSEESNSSEAHEVAEHLQEEARVSRGNGRPSNASTCSQSWREDRLVRVALFGSRIVHRCRLPEGGYRFGWGYSLQLRSPTQLKSWEIKGITLSAAQQHVWPRKEILGTLFSRSWLWETHTWTGERFRTEEDEFLHDESNCAFSDLFFWAI